jgi:hypothetical protein
MKIKIYSSSLLFAILFFTSLSYAQERVKLAQSGMKFLSINADARMIGLGEAVVSVENNEASSLYYNPAAGSRQRALFSGNLGIMNFIADIKYTTAALSFAPLEAKYGVIGFAFQNVDYGEFIRTVRAGDSYDSLGTYKPTAFYAGVSYSYEISELFSVGGMVKYVYQDLGTHPYAFTLDNLNNRIYKNKKFDKNVIAYDFGVLYKTGFKSLTLGIVIRNFSPEIEYVKESFQLPLTMKIGLSMNVLDLYDIPSNEHSLLVSVNGTKPRDYKEQINFGLEYTAFSSLSLRFGYINPTDEQSYNFGVGLKFKDLGFDYSFSKWEVFDNVHRISITFGSSLLGF